MILPYVYKLTHKETGQFYIGFRYANKIIAEEDLGVKYFSSSKKVKMLGFINFQIEILGSFFTAEAAYDFEQELINENFDDELILNEHARKDESLRFKCDNTGRRGHTHSLETREKIRNSNTGKVCPQEKKEKISKANKGKLAGDKHPLFNKGHTVETKERIGKANKGRKRNEDFKRKISKPILINGKEYYSIVAASESIGISKRYIGQLLSGRRKLNKNFWQVEYINKEKQ